MVINSLEYFTEPTHRTFWLFLLSSGVLALFFRRSLLHPKVLLHKSTQFDLLFFVLMSGFGVSVILPLIPESTLFITVLLETLHNEFGHKEMPSWSRFEIALAYTFILFILSDLSRYLLHYLMHKLPFLWRIHQFHHSASRLTPLTFYRIHPIESVLFGFRYLLISSLVTALFIYYFKASVHLLDMMGVNIFGFIFNLVGANLRHSHIPLSFGKLENLFISPAQHQLHHSRDATHHHKNFGGTLAIWDLLFKTHESYQKQKISFGLRGINTNPFLLLLLYNSPRKRKPL
jgi:sterol desaturase/sphingolipid hydroxylase (fatty acid hydroxylase superfamily)